MQGNSSLMDTATDPRLEELTKAAETFASTDQADLAEGLKDDLAAVKAQVQSLVPGRTHDAVILPSLHHHIVSESRSLPHPARTTPPSRR